MVESLPEKSLKKGHVPWSLPMAHLRVKIWTIVHQTYLDPSSSFMCFFFEPTHFIFRSLSEIPKDTSRSLQCQKSNIVSHLFSTTNESFPSIILGASNRPVPAAFRPTSTADWLAISKPGGKNTDRCSVARLVSQVD